MSDRRRDPGAPIVVSAYDLAAALYEHVNRFPRAQRTLLGRLILDEALKLLAALTLANRLADKREALEEASGRLDALRIAVRGSRFCPTAPTRGSRRRSTRWGGCWVAGSSMSGRERGLRRRGRLMSQRRRRRNRVRPHRKRSVPPGAREVSASP